MIDLNLQNNWKDADLVILSATDPHGRDIFTWTWPVQSSASITEKVLNQSGTPASKITAREDPDFVFISNGSTEVAFNKSTGMLSGVEHDEKSLSLSNGPMLESSVARFKKISHYQEGDKYIVEIEYEGRHVMNPKWIMHPNGWLELDCEFRMDGAFDNFGINFSYPEENITGMKWMGRGPYRVWKNRLRGQQFGIWHKDHNNTVTGES